MRKELRRQIESAEIVLIPAGMYDEHYDSLKFQMVTAKEGGIPIVALEPFGGVGEVHRDVTDRVAATVSWNERLIVDMVMYASGIFLLRGYLRTITAEPCPKSP